MATKAKTLVEDSLILTLYDVVNFMTKHGEVIAGESGLTVQQYLVLMQINNDPAFPQSAAVKGTSPNGILASDIANARGVSRSNISAIVAALLRRKLVIQKEDPEDRRRKFMCLTAKGKQALEWIEPLRHSVNAKLFADFTEAEKTEGLKFLQRWLEKLWHLEQVPGK